jgi:magnesium transporter
MREWTPGLQRNRTVITAYTFKEGRLVANAVSSKRPEACWLDMENPSDDELDWVTEVYNQRLPSMDALAEIEASSRFFQDESGLHIRTYFLLEATHRPYNVTAAFIVNNGLLFTLRDEVLISFQEYRSRLENQRLRKLDAFSIMLGLFEVKVDRLADLLEHLHIELEQLGGRVFHADERNFEDVLTLLAAAQDRNDKIRLGLMDKQRALSFLLRDGICPKHALPLLREILRDIRSLNEHSTFLFEKVQFLMDATTGRINVEQNKIIKIFSIAAVVFLPPTLIASIYGMNFHFLPELNWPFGYPLSLLLMIAAGIAPYLYFKRKGWL